MEPIRISKYFTDCGVMSRRAADAAATLVGNHVTGVDAVLDVCRVGKADDNACAENDVVICIGGLGVIDVKAFAVEVTAIHATNEFCTVSAVGGNTACVPCTFSTRIQPPNR